MKLIYTFESHLVAKQTFLYWAHYFSETYGMILQDFTSMTALGLFPYREVKVMSYEKNPWEVLKENIGTLKVSSESLHPSWMGFLSYEMGAFSFSDAPIPYSTSHYPLALFQKHAIYLLLSENSLILYLNPLHIPSIFHPPSDLQEFFTPSFWNQGMKKIKHLEISDPLFFHEYFMESKSSYLEKIGCIKDYIRKGDLFQINLSQSIKYQTSLSAFETYSLLAGLHPTPFSCFFNLGERQVICASPERFLSLTGSKLQTRPIKGTIKRETKGLNDRTQVQNLMHSSKERAELTMVSDLMRNDLGRISRLGSVQCTHPRKLLSLSTLHHVEAVIESKALDLHPIDLIRPSFPPGSVTGCPKVRAMEIISELEQRPRHLYCGAIGYFLAHGDFDLNVAIRTALYHKGEIEYQVGGGLTYDSDPHQEYQETLDKALSLKAILTPSTSLTCEQEHLEQVFP